MLKRQNLSWPKKLEDLEKILEQCVARKLPVVANPDFVTVEARDLRVMPGTLAAKYEELGGEVKWMGKPDKIIYESAMCMVNVDASDCIAMGEPIWSLSFICSACIHLVEHPVFVVHSHTL